MHCQGSKFKTNNFNLQTTYRTVFPTVFYSLSIVFLFEFFRQSLYSALNFRLRHGMSHPLSTQDITLFLGAQKAC